PPPEEEDPRVKCKDCGAFGHNRRSTRCPMKCWQGHHRPHLNTAQPCTVAHRPALKRVPGQPLRMLFRRLDNGWWSSRLLTAPSCLPAEKPSPPGQSPLTQETSEGHCAQVPLSVLENDLQVSSSLEESDSESGNRVRTPRPGGTHLPAGRRDVNPRDGMWTQDPASREPLVESPHGHGLPEGAKGGLADRGVYRGDPVETGRQRTESKPARTDFKRKRMRPQNQQQNYPGASRGPTELLAGPRVRGLLRPGVRTAHVEGGAMGP
ncbi:putative protein FAM90A12P, partial [Diceros bicornis minor]|uniref:putative protein FAM90A12P n=1 Tax=Diceros bicornis minor TaxID=77932 RepID=UPI0026EC5CAD